MNSVSRTTNSSPQCFGQASVSTDSDPSEPVSVSSIGSVESVRDRSHLFLDPAKKRTSTNAASDLLSSPVISKEIQDLLNNFASPIGIRQNSLQALAAVAQQRIQQNFASGLLETPTPTKVLYPKTVTEEQERFAKGFTEALRQIQQQNQFVNTPTLQSPNAASLILPLLAALTPTLNAAPTFPLPSSLSSPISASTPTKPAVASLGTPTSTVPPTNVVSGSALSATQLPIGNANNNDKSPTQSSGASSSTGTQLSPLEELYKKLDPTNPHSFMDMFQHPDIANSFQPFMNPALFHQTSALANTLPHPTMPLQNHNQSHHQPPVSNISGPMPTIKTEPVMHNENSGYLNGMNSAAMNCAPTTSNHMNSYSSNHTFDPDEQERKKLERKRARNRMAASKCRQRKMERIQELENLVQQEKQRAATFQQDIETLQKTIRQLSDHIDRHRQHGCSIPHLPTFKMPNL